ncbi:Z1 domain-containing protein [Streptomyces sp. NBC_00083]|uniref:Z1 domain-containing protein n=1 Tax=Streptomyces sp. NBC_00083 TaxID=2975647 RepID=UPI00225788DF|nr:Z1 domain-containing protein [Streptomyces sp. NBC_00083]MCX5382225.1 Z1 domain-containing protein [Streptomyces sp. NBC_00083]
MNSPALDLSALTSLHKSALAGMQESGPQRLARHVAFHAESRSLASDISEAAFREALLAAHSDDPLLWRWRKDLTQWDFGTDLAWTQTPPRTDERRAAIYDRLELEQPTRKLLTELVPVTKLAGPVVISRIFKPWRSAATTPEDHYWPKYAGLLAEKGWRADAVADLEDAAEQVVQRLANPIDVEPYQSRGLVVGYVQSGKTANFTGVIAKAVDAGYRLVIVLGGTLNLLRAQTQRRLDMELVGRENILRNTSEAESDYADDEAWAQGKFLAHGDRPSLLGSFDIIRLTTRENDYKSLAQGIQALEIEKQDPSAPLFAPANLHRSAARLMVVKKNKTVLGKLLKDLAKIGDLRAEIPVLIIDDESDEASVNTGKPDANRTAINEKISELLQVLPRAQYVGYTATPFANVFVDPSDTQDIFPRDFIISLDRPDGYMGVQDFHDIDSDIAPEDRNVGNSQEKAHVRDVVLTDEDDDTCLREAMDMFVLTAAMKIYRETAGPAPLGIGHFRHHTMLVHESRLTADHRDMAGKLLQLWHNGGYAGPAGRERLRILFEKDVAPVSRVRSDGFAVPSSFDDDLAPYIGAAYMRIGGSESPVIVVNGDKEIEQGVADFDRRGIWKILIGGQKLARGFTVEGLTVTYYRRRTNNASTLMQMGRWFGFRRGYQDLVRLYLGRSETMGPKEIDLYEAFEAICRDEEKFREQLKQYSVLIDGHPQVTPAQVPPLVSQHLPWLKPTSPNKMYNARLEEVRSPGKWEEPTAYPSSPAQLRHNVGLWTPVLNGLSPDTTAFRHCFTTPDGVEKAYRFDALTGHLGTQDLLALLRSLKWSSEQVFAPHLTYLESISKSGQVDDWLVLAPQHATPGKRIRIGDMNRELSWFARDRRRGPLFGAISEPKHRPAAHRVAGAVPSCGDPATEQFAAERRGVVVLYPLVEGPHRDTAVAARALDAGDVVMAFAFVAPASAEGSDGQVVRFVTIDSSQEDAAIIDRTAG